MRYDINKLILVAHGREEPATELEATFKEAYEAGVLGALLIEYLLSIQEAVDKMQLDEVHLLLIGYALGQKELEEAQETIDFLQNNTSDDIH